MPFTSYHGSIDELIEKDKHLFKGHLVNLWPGGYKVINYLLFYKEGIQEKNLILGWFESLLPSSRFDELHFEDKCGMA